MSPQKLLRFLAGPILLLVATPALIASAVQTFALNDTVALDPRNLNVEAVVYQGRPAVRVTSTDRADGLVFLRGVEFTDGTIEADVALKVTTPGGIRNPGFIGLAFRARDDARHYDLFYVRPGNAVAPDQAMRNHTVQYVASPDFGWYRLRRSWPWVYESYAEIQPETWTRLRIEVAGRQAKLFIGASAQPALVVDGLKGEDLRGGVALWGFPGQESYFSNVRITHAAPQPVENGGDPDGSWEIRYTTDYGNFSGSLTLDRQDVTVTGTASGLLGDGLPVSGTWRNGYLELTFAGTWAAPRDEPAPASATLAGWIDGNEAKGRVAIPGRADGLWTAIRRSTPPAPTGLEPL